MTNEEMVYYLKRADLTVGQKNKTKTAEAIEKALKIIATQPKRGKWIFVHPLQEDDEGAYMCSCCGVGNWGIDPKVDKYCFNCGAKMDADMKESEGK